MENSATENETFVQYFESYIKIWNDHSNIIEKNATKFLTPMRLEHERQGSKFKEFLAQVENMDLIYSQNQRNFAKKIQQLVNQNLTKTTVQLRNLVTKNHPEYKDKSNIYRDNIGLTMCLFKMHKTHFEMLEEMGGNNTQSDSFLSEQKYVACTNRITQAIYDLRSLLIRLWREASNLEA